MYFRAMTLLKRGQDDTSSRKEKEALGAVVQGGRQLTEERERMVSATADSVVVVSLLAQIPLPIH
jgi:hypothetical protein